MKIMGIDLSLSSPGFAITDCNVPIHYENITTSPDDEWFERIIQIRDKVIELIDSYNPDMILVENYSFGSRYDREVLGEVHGALFYILGLRGDLEKVFRVVSPTTLKSFITGNGRATKAQMVRAINEIYNLNLKVSQNDIADALALCHIGHYLTDGNWNNLTKNQERILKNILNKLEDDKKWLKLLY